MCYCVFKSLSWSFDSTLLLLFISVFCSLLFYYESHGFASNARVSFYYYLSLFSPFRGERRRDVCALNVDTNGKCVIEWFVRVYPSLLPRSFYEFFECTFRALSRALSIASSTKFTDHLKPRWKKKKKELEPKREKKRKNENEKKK